MKRRAATIAIALCVAAGIAILACWIRSPHARDEVVFHAAGRKWIVSTFPHHLFVLGHIDPGWWRADSYGFGQAQYAAEPQYLQLRYEYHANGLVRVGVPFWLPLLLFSAPPAHICVRWLQDRRRHRDGLCRGCGYDVRFSPGRCPDCGTPISDGPAAAPALT